MLRTDPILKKNFGNDSTENVGGATMSPNSAAIDLDSGDFPDIPVRTTSISPKAVPFKFNCFAKISHVY